MCNQFTLHHEFRIDTGGQNLNNRQTAFFLFVDPMDKEHKDPETIDLGAPCLARYMHKAWKKHQNTVDCVDISLALSHTRSPKPASGVSIVRPFNRLNGVSPSAPTMQAQIT